MYQKLKKYRGSLDLGTFKDLSSALVHPLSVWICTLSSVIHTYSQHTVCQEDLWYTDEHNSELALPGLKVVSTSRHSKVCPGSHVHLECQVPCSCTSTEVGRSNLDLCNLADSQDNINICCIRVKWQITSVWLVDTMFLPSTLFSGIWSKSWGREVNSSHSGHALPYV